MFFKSGRIVFLTCASSAALCLSANAPAFAGFDWTPPAETQKPAAAPQSGAVPMPPGSALPMPPVDQEVLSQKTALEDLKPVQPAKPVLKRRTIDPTEMAQQQLAEKPATAVPSPEPVTLSRKRTVPSKVRAEQVAAAAAAKEPQSIAPPPQPVSKNMLPELPPAEPKPMPVQKASGKPPSGLAINPYPMQADGTPAGDAPIALPAHPQPVPAMKRADADAPKEEITWNQTASYPVIEGFGSDIPLALALTQIVPPDYAYSFGEGVDPGIKISWSGGKPWNEVLSDVLTPFHMIAEVKGKKVLLKKMQKQAAFGGETIVLAESREEVEDGKKKLFLA